LSEPTYLLVMRLDQMIRVHPQMITMPCLYCKETCGVYPSGQRILKEHTNVALVCTECMAGADESITFVRPPEALQEAKDSVWRKKP
jgi:hypothetical protein